jgi:transcriptional regulator with XRE-family HTH domain
MTLETCAPKGLNMGTIDMENTLREDTTYAHALTEKENLAKLGARVRAFRKEHKLSIRALSEAANVSTGMISQIERGQAAPSLRSLRMLGAAMHVPVSAFFSATTTDRDEGKYVVRRNQRQLLKLSGSVMKELMSPNTLELLEIFHVTLQPGGESGPEPYSHAGEKAGIIISGSLELWLAGKPYQLRQGDTCQFQGTIPHRYCNIGDEPTNVIWVLTPPSS